MRTCGWKFWSFGAHVVHSTGCKIQYVFSPMIFDIPSVIPQSSFVLWAGFIDNNCSVANVLANCAVQSESSSESALQKFENFILWPPRISCGRSRITKVSTLVFRYDCVPQRILVRLRIYRERLWLFESGKNICLVLAGSDNLSTRAFTPFLSLHDSNFALDLWQWRVCSYDAPQEPLILRIASAFHPFDLGILLSPFLDSWLIQAKPN